MEAQIARSHEQHDVMINSLKDEQFKFQKKMRSSISLSCITNVDDGEILDRPEDSGVGSGRFGGNVVVRVREEMNFLGVNKGFGQYVEIKLKT